MLSRVANSIYWLSRYIERAENVARFIDVNYNMSLGQVDGVMDVWSSLVYTTGDHDKFEELYEGTTRENVLNFLAFDSRNPNSIFSCVRAARENARSVRESITMAMWEQVNRFYLVVKNAATNAQGLSDTVAFCEAVRIASHSLVGTAYTTMSHGEAWHFLQLGRLLERADKTSRIVDVQYFLLLPSTEDVGTSLDIVRWSALLKSTSALGMYRRVYGRIEPGDVAAFLLLNGQFPRAVRFCLAGCHDSMRQITGSAPRSFRYTSEKMLGKLSTDFDYTSIDDVVDQGMHEFIDDLQTRLNEIGKTIHEDFFRIPNA